MENVIECVPNFSVGEDEASSGAIVNAIKSVSHDVKVADSSYDKDHGRLVVTVMGEAAPLAEAVYEGVKKAVELVDISSHKGVHPYIGAVDVIPFIPIRKATFNDCVKLRNEISEKIGKELSIPVYIYGNIAKRPERKELSSVRNGGLEAVGEKITGPEGKPDYGPPKLHPTAGAVAVGCRDILIAFNVNLDSQDLPAAKAIAERIRESKGGMRGVRAIGVELKSRGIVQVAININNYKAASIKDVFDAVKAQASASDIKVKSSELVGLIPKDAAFEGMGKYLSLEDWNGSRIIENYLR